MGQAAIDAICSSADMKKPRVVNSVDGRTLAPASINRTLGLLRHMLNWAVGRQYLDRTPFRRGTEVLIRLEYEDNKRRRRVSEPEQAALLAVARQCLFTPRDATVGVVFPSFKRPHPSLATSYRR